MFENKKIFILGIARSGYEAAKLLNDYNNEILITDVKNDERALELSKLGINVVITDKQDELLDDSFDLVIKNPGIRYDNKVVLKAKKLNIKVINEVELSFHFLKKGVKVIGVTGSNGKTTTVNLIYEMFKKDKKDVYLGGNVGTPLSSFVRDIMPGSYLVLEISDHQLVDMYNFKTDISVLTNITKTHLDFHPSYEVYKQMKMKIFNHHTKDNYAILNFDNTEYNDDIINSTKLYFGSSNECTCYYDENKIYFDGEEFINTKDILLKGNHNYQNIAASIIVCKLCGVKNDSIIDVLKEFKGVEHRLEYVGESRGIKFYNDSKATNCVSTNIALKSFKVPTILLLGGLDRGHDFHDLDKSMDYVKEIISFGETKERIKTYANEINKPVKSFDTLKEAFKEALNTSKPGDVVLLSPACASWDQYKSFEERGNEFKSLVKEFTNE